MVLRPWGFLAGTAGGAAGRGSTSHDRDGANSGRVPPAVPRKGPSRSCESGRSLPCAEDVGSTSKPHHFPKRRLLLLHGFP